MKRWWALLLLAAISCTSLRDTRLLRKTNAIYASAVVRHDNNCVHITAPMGPPECPGEEAALRAYKKELLGYMTAFLLGPLPPSARGRLEQICLALEPK